MSHKGPTHYPSLVSKLPLSENGLGWPRGGKFRRRAVSAAPASLPGASASSAGDAGEQAHRGAHGTAVMDRRKTASPEGMEKLKKHLTGDKGIQEHKETPSRKGAAQGAPAVMIAVLVTVIVH